MPQQESEDWAHLPPLWRKCLPPEGEGSPCHQPHCREPPSRRRLLNLPLGSLGSLQVTSLGGHRTVWIRCPRRSRRLGGAGRKRKGEDRAQWRKVHLTGRPSGTGENKHLDLDIENRLLWACLLGLEPPSWPKRGGHPWVNLEPWAQVAGWGKSRGRKGWSPPFSTSAAGPPGPPAWCHLSPWHEGQCPGQHVWAPCASRPAGNKSRISPERSGAGFTMRPGARPGRLSSPSSHVTRVSSESQAAHHSQGRRGLQAQPWPCPLFLPSPQARFSPPSFSQYLVPSAPCLAPTGCALRASPGLCETAPPEGP